MIHQIDPQDFRYPECLKAIPGLPKQLWIDGDANCLSTSCLAIVGTRECTDLGKKLAYEFAKELSASGLTIVSGLAYGIDTAAHQGALEGGGQTIAVLGCGLDIPYPSKNLGLKKKISEQGALVTEFSPQTEPTSWTFPQRNRIISGLSLGVLVVEAPEKSGALLTASYALEQGREVFAIPGNINLPQCRGTNQLIQKGAKLVLTVNDILEEFPHFKKESCKTKEIKEIRGITESEKILSSLAKGPKDMDQLIDELGLSVQKVSQLLLQMEMEGHIRSSAGGVYTKEGL